MCSIFWSGLLLNLDDQEYAATERFHQEGMLCILDHLTVTAGGS